MPSQHISKIYDGIEANYLMMILNNFSTKKFLCYLYLHTCSDTLGYHFGIWKKYVLIFYADEYH